MLFWLSRTLVSEALGIGNGKRKGALGVSSRTAALTIPGLCPKDTRISATRFFTVSPPMPESRDFCLMYPMESLSGNFLAMFHFALLLLHLTIDMVTSLFTFCLVKVMRISLAPSSVTP